MVEREAVAREQVVREVETKRLQAIEPWTEQDERRFRLHAGAGGTLAGLGLVSLGTMAAGLALGDRVDQEGEGLLAADPSSPPEKFQSLRRQGTAYNRLAWATGAIGGALLISGTTVVIVAAVRRKLGKKGIRARLYPGAQGLEVRF